jgi:hypothetical protein
MRSIINLYQSNKILGTLCNLGKSLTAHLYALIVECKKDSYTCILFDLTKFD